MSKAAKLSLIILIPLLIGTLAFTFYTLLEKQKLEEAKTKVERELVKTEKDLKNKAGEVRKLDKNIKRLEGEKKDAERKLRTSEGKVTGLNRKIEELTRTKNNAERRLATVEKDRNKFSNEADKWKGRVDKVMAERDKLLEKIDNLKGGQPQQTRTKSAYSAPTRSRSSAQDTADQEEYWAGVLRQKAELEIKMQGLKDNISEKSVEIVGLKQQVSDLEVEIDMVMNAKEEIEREITFKEDLVDKVSLELARTKNDKKRVEARTQKIIDENSELRKYVKQLIASKGSMEKSIVRLSQEKDKIERELGKTDSIIQSKIDEIWEIKESLDKTIQKTGSRKSGEIELPPIVVSSDTFGNVGFTPQVTMPGFDGRVVSINGENNFIIVDIGKKAGVRLGDILSVYRDSKYIARVEVIQVRKDICASDIKDQWSKIQVGDIVR